jgi:hypothetical protein
VAAHNRGANPELPAVDGAPVAIAQCDEVLVPVHAEVAWGVGAGHVVVRFVRPGSPRPS